MGLVVQDDAQKRAVDLKAVVIFDEAHFLEFVHEEIHAGARGADGFGQGLLRYLGQDPLGLVLHAITRQQKKSAGEALLSGIK